VPRPRAGSGWSPARRYRLYPDSAQREALARAFGCARVVFNDGLRARQEARESGEKYLSDGDLSKQVITQAKDTPERAWLQAQAVAAGPVPQGQGIE
jgi:transposase